MADSFDEKLSKRLDEDFERLIAMLGEALDAEKMVRDDSGCPKCGCQHIRYMKVPDYKTKLQVAEFMTNRGIGRPAQVESERSGLTLIVERNWPVAGTTDPDELPAAS